MKILDGRACAEKEKQKISKQVSSSGGKPSLSVLLVGENPASKIYVHAKQKACREVGIDCKIFSFPSQCQADELEQKILSLNADPLCHAILLQLPLPPHLSPSFFCSLVSPDKDVDGLNPLNLGKLVLQDTSGFIPCTPLGISTLLSELPFPMEGQKVLILGRSVLVGKSTALLLSQKAPHGNASVSIAHRHTRNLMHECRQADVLIAAMGQPRFVKGDMIKQGAVLIDVGICKRWNQTKQKNEIFGDVDMESVKGKASFITPVPGGVGPMTIAMLLRNVLTSYLRR